ncbi:MAG: M56 family metallopeptidase [Clostridia bacterium]|nr:M56 family metallopeptidase [Clostridia bacterium]
MHSFLTSLLTMAFGGSVLVLAALLLRFVFKKLKAPAWLSILLWAAVAVRLLIPSLPKSTVSVMPQHEMVSEVMDVMVPAAMQAPAPAQENDPTVSFSADDPRTPTFHEGATGVQEPEEEKRFTPSAEFLFAVWGVGAAAVLGWGVLGWLRLEQRVRVSVKGEQNIYFCDDIKSPFLLGVFAPRIYVPSFLEGDALNNVLAHERAHIKRRDHLIKPFAFLLLAVYWFNPLFWISYSLLCRDIEYACDEKVFKTMDREAIASYSETLLTFHAPGRILSACPVAFGEVGVKRRIKAALKYKKPAFWIILSAALVLGCVCVFLLTDRTADVTRIFPAESEEIRAAVSEAALHEVSGKGWAEGAAEGHVMLGFEEKDGVTEVYAYCKATGLGFVNGVLTSEGDGFSGPCTFLLQPRDGGGYVCVDIIWPEDGEGRYDASIKEMMPPSLWRKAQRNMTAIVNAVNAKETEDAKAYLRSLGREARIELRRGELNLKTLTQLGAPLKAVERSEKERPTELEQCPIYVGTTEILENGVRMVYETALNADNQTIVYSKTDYASGAELTFAVFNAQTGEMQNPPISDKPADVSQESPVAIITEFIPAAITLSENESIRIYDADDTRVLAGVLRHDPSAEQDFGALKTMYELTLDGKNVISYANSSETGMFDARLCDNGYYALGIEKTECSLLRFANGKEPQIIYRASREPKQPAGLCVTEDGNIAVSTVSPENIFTCAIISAKGKLLSEYGAALPAESSVCELDLFPVPGGGVVNSAYVFDGSAQESVMNVVLYPDGGGQDIDGEYGKCRGVCGEYLLFSRYETVWTEGQTISLWKDGEFVSKTERKQPQQNVIFGFTPYKDGMLAEVNTEGTAYFDVKNGELRLVKFFPTPFISYGGITANGQTVFVNDSYSIYPGIVDHF